LIEADDWVPAQTAFERCGIGDGAPTEEIERLYDQLRDLDTSGKLEARAVTDGEGRKIYDRIRLRMV
jgi:type I restriction enzyme, S subunit